MGYDLNRKESDISKALKNMLDLMEKSGQIAHHDRLNSGTVFGGFGKSTKRYAMKLCRPGTPDRYIVLNNGVVIWLEIKSKSGIQGEDQKAFQKKVSELPGHRYVVARSLTQVIDFIDKN